MGSISGEFSNGGGYFCSNHLSYLSSRSLFAFANNDYAGFAIEWAFIFANAATDTESFIYIRITDHTLPPGDRIFVFACIDFDGFVGNRTMFLANDAIFIQSVRNATVFQENCLSHFGALRKRLRLDAWWTNCSQRLQLYRNSARYSANRCHKTFQSTFLNENCKHFPK